MQNRRHFSNFSPRLSRAWRMANCGRRLLISCAVLAPFALAAQTPPHLPPGGLIQLQVQQPGVDITSPVAATAGFDPPVARVGEKVFYRVSVDATESSVAWPDPPPVPAGLKFGAKTSGQLTQMQGNRFRPFASFVYEVKPAAAGHFTVPGFPVLVAGTAVDVPAASLEVTAKDAGLPAPRQLRLDLSETNVFLGEPFRLRVILPPGPNHQIEAVREIELNGDGLMTDKTALQQAIEPVNLDGELRPAFVAEMIATPIAAGRQQVWAQGFTAGTEFTAPFVIRGPASLAAGPAKYVLLVSDPVEIRVRPLPVAGELPGFTGAIGKFFADPPRLSANRVQVGEPVRLTLTFHGEGELTRFVPPLAPRSRDWQIIADPPPATSFTLVPLADDSHETPAIPFSYFDPETGKYVDLTIPPLPITVVGEGLPATVAAADDEGNAQPPLKLSVPARRPGETAGSLKPLQLRPWFMGLQLAPVIGFIALGLWDRRRRYLEAHPEIVRRARARRALRRERRELQKAADAGDTAAFVRHAARAMTIAVAPHLPANPQALVGRDVVAQLAGGAAPQHLATIRAVFAAADGQFATQPPLAPDLPALRPGVETLLQQLEEKL
jgi:hypothetical protein